MKLNFHKYNTLFLTPAYRTIIRSISAIFLIVSGMIYSGCSKSDEPNPDNEDLKEVSTSLLIYAVATNNLSYDFSCDMAEVLMAAEEIDLAKTDVWVYSVTPKSDPNLSKLIKDKDDTFTFEVVKGYDRQTYSTDPERISQVINDYLKSSKAKKRGLIFWSHATGWSPKFSDHSLPEVSDNEAPASGELIKTGIEATEKVEDEPKGWYGQDIYEGKADYCDLLELESAIPDSIFDFIWFDCCYMSSIEVLYQLRNKAPYIVAYPTEVAGEGLPYHITLPYIACEDINLIEAARFTAQYFLDKHSVVTICVAETAHLEDLAAEAAKAVGGERPATTTLQRYSRDPNGPFYDFGQYTNDWGSTLETGWDSHAFNNLLNMVVKYKAASEVGFDRRPINPENFSGISCHYFKDNGKAENEYYKLLDWYKVVYADFEN